MHGPLLARLAPGRFLIDTKATLTHQPCVSVALSGSPSASHRGLRKNEASTPPRAKKGIQIGVDASCWANARGYGRFTRELLREMVALAPDDRFVFFLDPSLAQRFDLVGPSVTRVIVNLGASPAVAASANGRRTVRDMLRLTRAVIRERLDVFFSPSVYTYFPLPPGLPCLATVHDAIPERHPLLTFATRRARLFWQLKTRLALRQADLVLTVSDFSAREIAEALHVAPSRIRIAGEAPAPCFRPSDSVAEIDAAAARVGLPAGARWFTYVGGFNPHKGVEMLVRAHAALAKETPDPPYLLLVGALEGDVFHGNLAAIRRAIVQAGTEALVRLPGYVPDDELRHLHSGALALILPSQREGFGLPAVEAAACGTPVVATIESPLPQLLQGGGRFIRPDDEPALIEALRFFRDDSAGRAAMGKIARDRARQLQWEDGARAALDALHELAS